MLVTIIFRNSAAKMQRLNYFTVIIIRDQSEVAYCNIYQIISLIRILYQKRVITIQILLKFQLKCACKVIELRSLSEMENTSCTTYIYICITTW